MASGARRIIEELFIGKNQWRRSDLVKRVAQINSDRGGLPGTQSAERTVKKALAFMKRDGVLEIVAFGTYRLIQDGDSPSDKGADDGDDDNFEYDSESVDENSKYEIEKVIGCGSESVYVYFNPNDRKLAILENRSTWECKVGRTDGDATDRIYDQGVGTAISRRPVIGLVIKTDHSIILEKIIQMSLRLSSNSVPMSLGTEWFFTSPKIIEEWISLYEKTLSVLSGGQVLGEQ